MQQINEIGKQKERFSNFELLRVVLMMLIVLHHYCINSGLFELIDLNNITANTIILQFLSVFGKMGINVFVLITGYFMICSKVSFKKVFLLWSEALFYNIIIAIIFYAVGYAPFDKTEFLSNIFYFTNGFNSSFLGTYLGLIILSPFINKAIKILSQKSLFVFNIIALILISFIPTITNSEGYVDYFLVMLLTYFIGAYLRLYPNSIIDKKSTGFVLFVASIILVYISILLKDFYPEYHANSSYLSSYFFKYAASQASFLMVTSAIGMFIWFKNINIKQNKIINVIAHSTLGVLFIHANSDAMRQWLWQDICKNTTFFTSPYFILIAIGVSLAVYFVCVIIDLLRWQLLEKPFVKIVEKKDLFNKVQNKCVQLMNKLYMWFSKGKEEE